MNNNQNNKICCIFGAGEYYESINIPSDIDIIIAADGGFSYLSENNLHADLIIGDFDSLDEIPEHENIIILPKEKNDTDMVAAIQTAWEKGCRTFHIYGGTGGCPSHTLANIQCIADLANRGAKGYLYDKDTIITAIKDSSISFPAGCFGNISVFSHSDISSGVFEIGLKYPLTDATLYNTYPLGISNEFTGLPVSIQVGAGTLIIIYPK